VITINNIKKIRLFVALPVPEALISWLEDVQNSLKKKGVRASWSSLKTLHLTLKFMGDTPLETLDSIIKAVQETATVNKPFKIRASRVGLFFYGKQARVIWAGVESENELLEELYLDLESYLVKAGIPRSKKRFSPHLTLARPKGCGEVRELLELVKQFENHRSESFECNSIDLYKSVLKPSGAVHTLVSRVFMKR